MKDLTNNMLRFSWAMGLYSARQAARLLNPAEVLKGAPGAAASFGAVTDTVVEQFSENLRQTFEVGEKIQTEMVQAIFGFVPAGGASAVTSAASGVAAVARAAQAARCPATSPLPIFDAHSTAGEQVLISYTRGEGRFSADKRYIALTNRLYQIDGREDGVHKGTWEALFSNPQQLLVVPPSPTSPMDQPVGPVEHVQVTANTIAQWNYADGSSISSVGPAASHLIPLTDGSFLFLVITAQIITQGTGRWAGAAGLTQSLGATHIPAGVDLFGPDVTSFKAMTLDTFKVRVVQRASGVPGGGRPASPTPSPTGAPGAVAPAGRAASCYPTGRASDSKFVEVLGSKMHYLDVGVGEPVVFLHGNPTWSYLWRNVIPEVAPAGRCIVPDLIGMGLSDKPDLKYGFAEQARYLEAFLDTLNLRKFTLVLHDWGCIFGFDYARRFESRIRGLAFMEALMRPYASWNDFPAPLRDTFKAFRTPNVGYEQIVSKNVFIERLLPGSMIHKLTPTEMDCYRLPFLDPLHRRVIWQLAQDLPIAGEPGPVAQRVADYASWLETTELPKLLLWAEPGAITSKAEVERNRKSLKNLEDVFLGPGIHFHQEDHPKEIGVAVAEWLGKLS